MNKRFDQDEQDNVVIIEEKDKRTILYISIAAVLGAALGGLIGSVATQTKWDSAYHALENQFQQYKQIQAEKVVEIEHKKEMNSEQVEETIRQQVTQKVELIKMQSEVEIKQYQFAATEFEKVNMDLTRQVETQSAEIEQRDRTISQLESQLAMQSQMFESAREVFQRELTIKQDLSRLQNERLTLEPEYNRFKKECDRYLFGSVFDANSTACDKQDELNAEINQIDQLIEVHKLDLREIETISESIGL